MKFRVRAKKCEDAGVQRATAPFALLLASFIVSSCSAGYDLQTADGGVRDMLFVDRAPIDATQSDMSVSLDGSVGPDGSVDSGTPSACYSPMCDPRSSNQCSPTMSSACLLEDDGPICEAMVGRGRQGDACVLDGDCSSTLACFASRAGGRCERVCCAGDAFACGTASLRCDAPSMLVGGGTSTWGRCVPVSRPCDVLTQDTCDPGEACYVVSGTGDTDCRPQGAAAVGESCVRANDCAPELVCTGVGVKKCAQICDLAVSTSCAALPGTMCRSYAYSPPGTGVCTEPLPSGRP